MGQYPYEQDEDGQYYSGYDDTVHEGDSYTGYSNWVSFPHACAFCLYSSTVFTSIGRIPRPMGMADPSRSRAPAGHGPLHATGLPRGWLATNVEEHRR